MVQENCSFLISVKLLSDPENLWLHSRDAPLLNAGRKYGMADGCDGGSFITGEVLLFTFTEAKHMLIYFPDHF